MGKLLDKFYDVVMEDDDMIYEQEEEINEYMNLSLEEIEDEIVFLYNIINNKDLKSKLLMMFDKLSIINKFNELVQIYNEKNKVRNIVIDKDGIHKKIVNYTGIFNNNEYFWGIKVLDSKSNKPNMRVIK